MDIFEKLKLNSAIPPFLRKKGHFVVDDTLGIALLTATSFKEKPKQTSQWINGGFFVCEPEVFDYIPAETNEITFEKEPLENIKDYLIRIVKKN